MSIDSKLAAKVASENGLTLADARALAALADSEEEAAELARQFVPKDNPRELADRVTGRTF